MLAIRPLGSTGVVLLSLWLAAPAAWGQADEPDPEATRRYAVALGFQKKGLYPQAAARWTQFLQAYPNEPRVAHAHYHLGICQFRQQDLPAAAATFRLVLARFPQFPHRDGAQFNLALVRYNVALESEKPEEYRKAAAAFAETAAKFADSPHTADALFYQAECLCAADDLEAAVPVYRQAISQFPETPLQPDLHHALGTTLHDLEKHAEAAETFQTFLQKFPEADQAAECRLRLGMARFSLQQYAEAEKLFAEAAGTNEFEFADYALLRQAQAVLEQDRTADAAALYESLPQKFAESPHVGAALLAAGKCRYRLEQYPQAQTALVAVVEQKGDEAPEAAWWLGRTLLRLDKPAEAVAALDAAIAAWPESEFLPQLAFTRIDALHAQDDHRAGTVALYAEFASKHVEHPLAPEALYRAARTALRLGEHATARQHAEAFLANAAFAQHELLPDVLLVGGESCLLAEERDLARAEALYRRIISDHPEHAHVSRAQVRTGLCLFVADNYDETIAFLNGVVGPLTDPELLAEARLLIGRSHAERQRHQEAVTAFRGALEAHPEWDRGDEVLYALALSLRAADDPNTAVAELNRLNEQFPQSPFRDRALYQLADIAFDSADFDAAAAGYRRVVADFPESDIAPAAQYGVGAALFEKEEFAPAAAELGTLLTKWPEAAIAPRGHYLRGLSHQQARDFEAAVNDLTQFLAGSPEGDDALDARFALGLCQTALEQHEEAVKTFSALLTDKPDYGQADKLHYELAFAHLAADNEADAARTFEALVTKFPDSPLAPRSWFRLGEHHESAERFAEAAKAFSAGLDKAREPELREALAYKLAGAQYRQQEFAEALKTLEAQLREHPQGTLAHDAAWLAGESLYRQAKFGEALPWYAQVVASPAEKYHARALYRSGDCAAAVKRWPESEKHYQQLIERFPQFEQLSEARYGLGFALQNQQKFDQAQQVYEQVTKETRTETAARARFMIGECAFARKDYAEAVEHFLETAFGYPYKEWQAVGYYEAGRCFVELGEADKALDVLETMVRKFPDHPRKKDAETLMARLNGN